MIEPQFRYLNFRQVAGYRGCSVSTLYNDIAESRFPAGERLGANTVRWRSDVVAAWLEEQSRNSATISEEITKKAKARTHLAVEGKRRKAQERAALAAAQ
ncbi:MAG: AlpA family phage regulatory protein [Sulfuritalea sp.]|jgi:predicted DNA-binding transcriptional regulator AlpA|nr:AlpA family phage regulatory protein [Sulfuritalea sp.]